MRVVTDRDSPLASLGPTRTRTGERPLFFEHNRVRTFEEPRLATATALGGIVFLLAYMTLHGLHVIHGLPALIANLSPVPLFATSLASALAGFGSSALSLLLMPHSGAHPTELARVLALVIALFALEMLLFP